MNFRVIRKKRFDLVIIVKISMNVDRFFPRIILYTSKKYCKSKELFSENFQSELLVKEYLGEVKQGFMLIHTVFSYR